MVLARRMGEGGGEREKEFELLPEWQRGRARARKLAQRHQVWPPSSVSIARLFPTAIFEVLYIE